MFELPLEEQSDSCLMEEQRVKKEIEAEHGKDKVILNYGHVSKEVRWALMAVSDIWVMTSLRQGYTLVIYSFYSQHSFNKM